MLVTLLTLLFYYYPSILTSTLSLFTCYRLDQNTDGVKYWDNARAQWPGGYWLPDMTMQCWTGTHHFHALLPGVPLFIICVLIPSLPVLLLWRSRKQLQTNKIRSPVGFIYRPYRMEFWFWDSVILWQTFFVAVALVFATSLNSLFQISIMLTILMAGFAALTLLRPFQAPQSQQMQGWAMLSVQFTAMGCLYFIYSSQTSVDKEEGTIAVGVLLLLLNLLFLLAMIVKIVRAGRADIQKVCKWLQSKAQLTGQRCRAVKHCWWHNKSLTSLDVAMASQRSSGLTALVTDSHSAPMPG